MRIFMTAAIIATTFGAAEADSIVRLGSEGAIESPSVITLGESRSDASAPSIVALGEPAPPLAATEPDPMETAATRQKDVPLASAPMPTVIRAGIEGEAFTRAAPSTPEPTPSAATPEAPSDETEPAAQTSAAPQNEPSGTEPQPIEPQTTLQ